ncbi:MAG: alanine racemase [Elusimicrobia bacterium]|nr:alanine racemase [Elusimicrobiota bacterium]
MEILRPTRAEINLKDIKYNVGIIKKFVGKDVEILAVVKADAYGHGAINVAKTLEKSAVQIFGVATIEEGIELRLAGIKKDILILGSTYPFSNFSEVIKYELTPTIASISGIESFNNSAKIKNKKLPFHLKIDTGMGRLGISPLTAVGLIKKIKSMKNIYIDGIYSHLACAAENGNFTEKQIRDFTKLSRKISARFIHIAASAAIIKYKSSHFNLVRPGLLIYGLLPFKNSEKILPVKPVLTLKTKIIYLKTVTKNTSISYCRTFITDRVSKIATIPIGYADGFLRYNSNNAKVLVHGKKASVVGRVCMDMTMLDVTGIKNVIVGDEVVIIGSQGNEKISAENVAKRCNTLNYEVVTSISKRVPRVYV